MRVNRARRIIEIERTIRRRQLQIHLVKAADRSDVSPIAVKHVPHDAPRSQRGGNQVFAEIVAGRIEQIEQQFCREDVNPHRGHERIGRSRHAFQSGQFIRFRFFFEQRDFPVGIALENAQFRRGGGIHRLHGQRDVRVRVHVELHELLIIHLIQMVARQNQHVFRMRVFDFD